MTRLAGPARTVLVFVSALAFVTCSTAGTPAPAGSAASGAPTTLKEAIIGAPLALTGPAGSVGLDIQQAAQLALDEANNAGGVAGYRFSLTAQDTTGDAAQAVQLVNSWVKDSRVMAILGPVNAAEVGAVTGIGESAKLVIFSPASAGAVPGVTGGVFNGWTFRLNEALPLVVGPQMTTVVGMTKAKTVTVLNYSDNAAYVDIGDRWTKAAQDAGATVQRIQFPAATKDFAAIVTSIKPSDLIAIGALSATDAQLVRDIRQGGLKAPIMGDASMLSSEVYDGSRGASEGALAYSTYLPDANAASTTFQKAFKAKFNKEPTAINAYAYEAVKLMLAGVGKGPLTRDAIRAGLAGLKGYEGITGTIGYNGSGDALRSSVPLVRVGKDGAISKVGEIVPNTKQ